MHPSVSLSSDSLYNVKPVRSHRISGPVERNPPDVRATSQPTPANRSAYPSLERTNQGFKPRASERNKTLARSSNSDGDMLLVDGEPVSCSSPTLLQGSGGRELVAALVGSTGLRAATDRLRAAPERRISTGLEGPRHVYVFQREYATVDPARVELVGTDELTTCVGVVIRNNKTGMTSVSHMDFPRIVEGGLKQMLEILGDDNAPFDVHLIGGFNDASTKVVHSSGRKHNIQEGYSYPLCCKIVEALHKSQIQFHLGSFCVLENNTTTDSHGNTRPIHGGFVVQTSSGVVTPASFDMTSRCPDKVVRRIRVSVSSYDPSWQGRLLETYNTHSDSFQIAPTCWMLDWAEIALSLNQLSDSEVLLQCSPLQLQSHLTLWKMREGYGNT